MHQPEQKPLLSVKNALTQLVQLHVYSESNSALFHILFDTLISNKLHKDPTVLPDLSRGKGDSKICKLLYTLDQTENPHNMQE